MKKLLLILLMLPLASMANDEFDFAKASKQKRLFNEPSPYASDFEAGGIAFAGGITLFALGQIAGSTLNEFPRDVQRATNIIGLLTASVGSVIMVTALKRHLYRTPKGQKPVRDDWDDMYMPTAYTNPGTLPAPQGAAYWYVSSAPLPSR